MDAVPGARSSCDERSVVDLVGLGQVNGATTGRLANLNAGCAGDECVTGTSTQIATAGGPNSVCRNGRFGFRYRGVRAHRL